MRVALNSIAVTAFSAVLLTACGDALTVSAEERAACDGKVSELTGRRAVGEDISYHVNQRNATKYVRIIYQPTSDFAGVQCDLVEGEVAQIVEFRTIFPVPGEKI